MLAAVKLLTLVGMALLVACGATSTQPTASTLRDVPAVAQAPADASVRVDDAPVSVDETLAKHDAVIRRCVAAARARRNEPNAEITIDIGIDRDGSLIGAKTPRGASPDDELNACVVQALHGAHFPQTDGGALVLTRRYSKETGYP